MKKLLPCLMMLAACESEPAGKAAVSLHSVFNINEPKSARDTTANAALTPWKALPEKEAGTFINHFEYVDPGEIHVSAYHDYSYQIENYRAFAGRPLSVQYKRILSGVALSDLSEVYACQRFSIDDSTYGMIFRHSGMPNMSSISLCLWDVRKRKFIPGSFLLSVNDEKKLQRKDTRILRKAKGRTYLLFHVVKCSEEGVPVKEKFDLYAIDKRKIVRWKKKPNEL